MPMERSGALPLTQIKPCLRRGQGWGSGWGGSGSKAETKAKHGQVAMERGWESRWTESGKSWANSNTGAPGRSLQD